MAAKAKNSKKQQQTVTTAMVTWNPFVVPNEIFGKISTAAASPLPDMDGNSSSTSPKMGQDQPLAVLSDVMEMESTVPPPVSGAADASAWENVNGHQRFFGWVASNLVPGTTFKIKLALLSSLFQLLPSCIGLKSVLRDAVKLFCVEFASQKCLNDATKVVIGDEVFLTTLKIAQSSGVASVSSSSLLVALHDVPLGTFSDDIKTALGIFGVVISDISSAAAALSNWSVLVRKDSVRILPIANQKEVISSRDAFKAKLVNFLFSCTAFEISYLVSQVDLNHLAVDCKKLPPLPPKLPSNTFGGPKNFKSSFGRSKSYAKAAAFVIPSGVAAANMELDLGGPSKTTTPVLSAVPSVPNTAVESRLASLESHFIKECVNGLAKQNKGLAAVATMMQKRLTCLETISEQICLENGSDVDDMVDDVDDDDDENKDFSKNQPLRIKSSPDQTAKWMSGMVKNSHELVSIMGKMYELDMFDTLGSKHGYTLTKKKKEKKIVVRVVRAEKTNLLTGLLLKIFGLFEVVETTLELTRVCLFEGTLTGEELPAKGKENEPEAAKGSLSLIFFKGNVGRMFCLAASITEILSC
ncbi:hypothetical protein G9A89_005567 [Geosiphon pyriformis]|nr:hypothetical protein G9A89_005567 [Geosiphon pyriformis]